MREIKRLVMLIDKRPPSRKGVCLDCYNQKWNKRVHITITARYDDSNKFVTQAYERR